MNSFKNAESFFHNCESAKGWDACKDYVAENATFKAQSEPLVDVTKVKDYVDWMTGLGTITAPGSSYEIHASAYDETNNVLGLTAWSISTAKEMFKGSKINDAEGEMVKVNFKVRTDEEDIINFSKTDMAKMKAEIGF